MTELGRRLALAGPTAAVVYIAGELGAGKTTLIRGMLRGLGVTGTVKSPTYTLVEPYALGELTVYHLDLYRLGEPIELEYLGIRDYFGDAVLFLIEWPERAASALPHADLRIQIDIQALGREVRLMPLTKVGKKLASVA